jgi:Thiol:disulfide interchange protein
MKRYIRHIILLTALFVVAVGVGVATSPSTPISWYDYNDGMKLAEEEDKPMMINFGADWCRFCGKLDEKTFTDGQVIALSESFVCIKVDVDQGREITKKFKIRPIPAIVFADSQGHEIHRVIGFKNADKFLKEMHTALSKAEGS